MFKSHWIKYISERKYKSIYVQASFHLINWGQPVVYRLKNQKQNGWALSILHLTKWLPKKHFIETTRPLHSLNSTGFNTFKRSFAMLVWVSFQPFLSTVSMGFNRFSMFSWLFFGSGLLFSLRKAPPLIVYFSDISPFQPSTSPPSVLFPKALSPSQMRNHQPSENRLHWYRSQQKHTKLSNQPKKSFEKYKAQKWGFKYKHHLHIPTKKTEKKIYIYRTHQLGLGQLLRVCFFKEKKHQVPSVFFGLFFSFSAPGKQSKSWVFWPKDPTERDMDILAGKYVGVLLTQHKATAWFVYSTVHKATGKPTHKIQHSGAKKTTVI